MNFNEPFCCKCEPYDPIKYPHYCGMVMIPYGSYSNGENFGFDENNVNEVKFLADKDNVDNRFIMCGKVSEHKRTNTNGINNFRPLIKYPDREFTLKKGKYIARIINTCPAYTSCQPIMLPYCLAYNDKKQGFTKLYDTHFMQECMGAESSSNHARYVEDTMIFIDLPNDSPIYLAPQNIDRFQTVSNPNQPLPYATFIQMYIVRVGD